MYPSVEKIPADEILYTGREGAELMNGNHPTVLCFTRDIKNIILVCVIFGSRCKN